MDKEESWSGILTNVMKNTAKRYFFYQTGDGSSYFTQYLFSLTNIKWLKQSTLYSVNK